MSYANNEGKETIDELDIGDRFRFVGGCEESENEHILLDQVTIDENVVSIIGDTSGQYQKTIDHNESVEVTGTDSQVDRTAIDLGDTNEVMDAIYQAVNYGLNEKEVKRATESEHNALQRYAMQQLIKPMITGLVEQQRIDARNEKTVKEAKKIKEAITVQWQ